MQRNTPSMAFFNFLNTNCRVSARALKITNASKIIWTRGENQKKSRKISSYNVIHIKKLDINTTYIGEIYLTEQLVDEISTNQKARHSKHQPIDTIDSDSSQSDGANISNESFCADTLFISKPDESNDVLSDPDKKTRKI